MIQMVASVDSYKQMANMETGLESFPVNQCQVEHLVFQFGGWPKTI